MAEKATTNGQRAFLADVELRPLRIEDSRGLEPVGLDELTKEKVGGLVVKLYSKRGCDAFF